MLQTIIINTLLVLIVVLIHYEMLGQLSQRLMRLTNRRRILVVVGVFGAMVAHAVEIWVFALGYFFMLQYGGFGELQGNFAGTLLDCAYFSFSNYTSLGTGDIEPLGNIRFLAGIEALTGLVLITWSASFMFIEMQKFWQQP